MHTDIVSSSENKDLVRLQKIPTSTLANALDKYGVYENIFQNINGIVPGLKVIGPAITVKEITGEANTFESSDFAVGAIIDVAKPGEVIVIEEGGAPYSTWGGMASLAAKVKGIAGIVVDGGVRDFEEIKDLNFPVFSRYLTPTTGRTRLKVDQLNVPVNVGSVRVCPGDIIVGDGTGILSIPSSGLREITKIAERYVQDDSQAAIEIRSGLSFSEAMRKFSNL